MSDFGVRLDKRKLEQIIRQSPQKAEDAVEALAREGERIVKMSFGTGPAGVAYTRGNVTHVASAPGYPPNIDVGNLVNSITVAPRGPLRRAISTDVEYGPFLEFGTERMAARPFMAPMAVELEREQGRIFDGFLD